MARIKHSTKDIQIYDDQGMLVTKTIPVTIYEYPLICDEPGCTNEIGCISYEDKESPAHEADVKAAAGFASLYCDLHQH